MSIVDDLVYLLSDSQNPEVQEKALGIARQTDCLSLFFQPITKAYSKETWEKCAQIIAEHTDEALIPYLTNMLLWLEDMNWPGASIIQERLIAFQDVEILAFLLTRFTVSLYALSDTHWLSSLAPLLTNHSLLECVNNEVRSILKKYL